MNALAAAAWLMTPACAAPLAARSAAASADSSVGVDAAVFDAESSTGAAAALALYAAAGVKWARVSAGPAEAGAPSADPAAEPMLEQAFVGGQKTLLALRGADAGEPTAWVDWAGAQAASARGSASAFEIDADSPTWGADAAAFAALARRGAAKALAADPGAEIALGFSGRERGEFARAAAVAAADAARIAVLRGDDGAVAALRAALGRDMVRPDQAWVVLPAPPQDESRAVRAKRMLVGVVSALGGGAARVFFARDRGAEAADPSDGQDPFWNAARSLADLFGDGVSATSSARLQAQGAVPGFSQAAFMTRRGEPVLAFWSGAAPSDDGVETPVVLSLTAPINDPVLVDPLSADARPLGSGTQTVVSARAADYPRFVTAASVLRAQAASLIVAEQVKSIPEVSLGDGPVELRFTTTAPADAAVEVFTERRELLRRFPVRAVAGRNSVEWDAQHYGDGVYYWRVSAGGEEVVRRVVVARARATP